MIYLNGFNIIVSSWVHGLWSMWLPITGYTKESDFAKDNPGGKYKIGFKLTPTSNTKTTALIAFFAWELARSGHNLTVYELSCWNCKIPATLNQALPGMTAYGVDGFATHEELGPRYIQWDLEKFLPLKNADYIMWYGCGEHIHPDHEQDFLRTLVLGASQKRLDLRLGSSWAGRLRTLQRTYPNASYLQD